VSAGSRALEAVSSLGAKDPTTVVMRPTPLATDANRNAYHL
jgi:hypothetical protein